jgi:predicted transcriptional regulator
MFKTRENVINLLKDLSKANVFQAQIAEELEVTQPAVSQWSRGETMPKGEYWNKLLRLKERVDQQLVDEARNRLALLTKKELDYGYQQSLFGSSMSLNESIETTTVAVLEKPKQQESNDVEINIDSSKNEISLRDRIQSLSEKEAKEMLETILSATSKIARELPKMTKKGNKITSNALRNLIEDILKERGLSLNNYEETRMYLLSKIPIDISTPSYQDFKAFLLGESNELKYVYL